MPLRSTPWLFEYPFPIVDQNGRHHDSVVASELVRSEQEARNRVATFCQGLTDVHGAPVDLKKFTLVSDAELV